jgi:hypothetical protein
VPRRPAETFPCPNCGEDVPAGARACPECGSDEETGWSSETLYDGLDLPDPGYGPVDDPRPAPRRSGFATAVAIVLLAACALLIVLGVL